MSDGAIRPNPGSPLAQQLGCTCPVIDNGHGRGCGRYDEQGKPQFWINETCQLHNLRAAATAVREGEHENK